jgi:hypothetical protein
MTRWTVHVDENKQKILFEYLKRRNYFGDLSVDERIKWMLIEFIRFRRLFKNRVLRNWWDAGEDCIMRTS